MSIRPIILVTQRVIVDTGTGEGRDALAQDWADWGESLGVSIVPVPNSLADPVSWAEALRPTALVLSGGNDLADVPARDVPVRELAPGARRERTETLLLAWAISKRLPTIGVCRGMQFINRYFGGGISRDINARPAALSHVATRHGIRLDATYAPAGITGRESVNSYHNQGVREHELAPALRAFAFAEDDIVEGIVHPDYPITAVQWHPERDPGHAWSAPLLRDLLPAERSHTHPALRIS